MKTHDFLTATVNGVKVVKEAVLVGIVNAIKKNEDCSYEDLTPYRCIEAFIRMCGNDQQIIKDFWSDIEKVLKEDF